MDTDKLFLPSLFQGFFTKQSVAADWVDVYNSLTDGTLRELTERFRATREWRYKSTLPCLTPACRLNGKGKEAADLVGLTGVSMADFDHIPAARMEEVRTLVNADPHTFLSYVTVSGEGLRILFRYEGASLYGEAFLTGNCYYADLIGCDFDEKCANVNRLSALCHDSLAFFNVQALPFRLQSREVSSKDTAPFRSNDTAGSVLRNASEFVSEATAANMPNDTAGSVLRNAPGSVSEATVANMPNDTAGSIPPDTPPFVPETTAPFAREEEVLTAFLEGHADAGTHPAEGFPREDRLPHSPLSPTDYAAEIVERHGDCYTEGNRNQYLMKCLMMMNKLGVPQADAEDWALSHDLGEAEIRRIVRSCYAHTAEYGMYDLPQRRPKAPRKDESCKVAKVAEAFSLTHAREEEECLPLPQPPLLPAYEWPRFLRQIADCGETDAQRDVLLLGAFTVLGASLNRKLRFLYGRKFVYPCLQTFVVAPPASGKGALTWVRKLVEPIHERMMGEYQRAAEVYKREKMIFDQAGRTKSEMETPRQPPLKMFLIAGNNSATGVLENLIDAGGVGLICESEADTVSTAIGSDYGHWSDTLRKAFDHDRLSFNRRTNHEYREVARTFLSVLLSGTPAQVQPLIPSAENGLFSRQIFYAMPPTAEWIDQFGNAEGNDLDRCFEAWGTQWEELLQKLTPQISVLTFGLTDAQQRRFNEAFAALFDTACLTLGGTMKSSVTRLAVNILRLMAIVAFLRGLEDGRGFSPADDIPAENIADGTATRFGCGIAEADFEAVLALIHPLYQHAAYILALLPKAEVTQQKAKPADLLMTRLGTAFTAKEAMDAAASIGLCTNTLKSHLQRLIKEGVVQRTKRGHYRLTRARV